MDLCQHYMGYVSTALMLYCLLFKQLNKFIIRIDNFRLVKIHMYSGLAVLVLSIIHAYDKILINGLSFGNVALIIMIIIVTTGLIVKNSRGEKRKRFLGIHKGFCVIEIIVIIIHIAEYYIMEF